MHAQRYAHTATLLSNGKVLVTGGKGSTVVASAELYDPATGTWTTTSSMNYARDYHTADLLPSGNVLIVGGASPTGTFLSAAELYVPAAAPLIPIVLNQPEILPAGACRLSFTNAPNASFTVYGVTNLATGSNAWVALGAATEVSSGSFQFTDSGAGNRRVYFYRVVSP